MILITMLFMIGIGILGAYTSAFQDATLYLGKQLALDNSSSLLSTGLQDAITPKGQNFRNILFLILLVTLLIYGFIFYSWYITICLPILTLIIIVPFLKLIVMPKPNSTFYRDKIKINLERRLESYERNKDVLKTETIRFVLEKFKSINCD